jgi:hypothetical protein
MRFCLPLPHLPVFPKASGERGFLLAGLELRQQESVSDTNLLGVERLDHGCGEFGEFETGAPKCARV